MDNKIRVSTESWHWRKEFSSLFLNLNPCPFDHSTIPHPLKERLHCQWYEVFVGSMLNDILWCCTVMWLDFVTVCAVCSSNLFSHCSIMCFGITNDMIIIIAYCYLLKYTWTNFYWILWDLHRVNELKYLNWTRFGETKWLTCPLSPLNKRNRKKRSSMS